ncbi:MAG: alanine racemase [Bacteroidales bacterium]|nr:alanine racemase [Bacteroidales bacterium]
MKLLNKITEPTLLLDKRKCLMNIRRMKQKADKNNVQFRPHFKTHQSIEIGKWFRQEGVLSISVSSLKMARYFAEAGWNDITLAFPVNIREALQINELAGKIKLNLLFIHEETVEFLNQHLENQIGGFIKIDTGYHRSGIPATDKKHVKKLYRSIRNSGHIQFKGLLVHTGQNYHAVSKTEIVTNYCNTIEQLHDLADTCCSDQKQMIVSVGDTPSCSIVDDLSGVDEIRPGNFVFYDLMQYELGSCPTDQIAVAMACPVVSVQKERNEVVIWGGAIHFSKEYILRENNITSYGQVVELNKEGWKWTGNDEVLISVSQEHGIVKLLPEKIANIKPGDLIGIIPVHSCLTANLMKGYLTLEGEKIDHLNGRLKS